MSLLLCFVPYKGQVPQGIGVSKTRTGVCSFPSQGNRCSMSPWYQAAESKTFITQLHPSAVPGAKPECYSGGAELMLTQTHLSPATSSTDGAECLYLLQVFCPAPPRHLPLGLFEADTWSTCCKANGNSTSSLSGY